MNAAKNELARSGGLGGLGGLGSYVPPGPPTIAPITIQFRDTTGEKETCVVNMTSPLREVFKAYATRKGVAVDTLRFTVPDSFTRDGLKTLTGNEMPARLGLIDGSTIGVWSNAPPAPAQACADKGVV